VIGFMKALTQIESAALVPITIFHRPYILFEESPCHHKKRQGIESETV